MSAARKAKDVLEFSGRVKVFRFEGPETWYQRFEPYGSR